MRRIFRHSKGFHLITTAQRLLRFYYESVMNASPIRVDRSSFSGFARPPVGAQSPAGFLP